MRDLLAYHSGFSIQREIALSAPGSYDLKWSPTGEFLVLSNMRGTMVLDLRGEVQEPEVQAYWPRQRDVAWSPDGKRLALSEGGAIVVFQAPDFHHYHVLYAPPTDREFGPYMAWSPNGRTLACLDVRGGVMHLVDVETGESAPVSLPVQHQLFRGAAWSPNGEVLAFSLDRRVWLWERATGGWSGPPFSVSTGPAWLPNSLILAVGTFPNSVAILDVEHGRITHEFTGHVSNVRHLTVSGDGRLLASRSRDGEIRIWDLIAQRQLAEVEGRFSLRGSHHPGSWEPIAFHPQLPLLAVPDWRSRNLYILNVDAGQLSLRQDGFNYTTAKVVLVGDSGVGKTGLGWCLAGNQFKEHASTHGQQFWVLNELKQQMPDGSLREFVLWDLAGQPDYRLIHTLFLDDTDVALLVFDPSNRQEILKGVEYWLNVLARRNGRPCRTILVGARTDRGDLSVTESEIQAFCARHGIAGGYVGTSAFNGEGLESLKARVRAQVPWEEKTTTTTTREFKVIKDCVLELRAKQPASKKQRSVLLTAGELQKEVGHRIPMSRNLSDEKLMAAVENLTNHGFVSVLRGSTGKKYILLQPDLLNNLAASFVLAARANPKGLGALDESAVRQGSYHFPELAALPETDRMILLDAAAALFLEKNICFRQQSEGTMYLVFPALINLKKPTDQEVETEDETSYTVYGAVENVYAAMVVLLGYTKAFTRTRQWQNQAQYEFETGEVCGFRLSAERDGEIDLVLMYGTETLASTRALFQGLFERFLRERDVRVMRYPSAVCPACGYRPDRGEVIRRIKMGRGVIGCPECFSPIPIPIAAEEVAMSPAEREKIEQERLLVERRTLFEQVLVHLKRIAADRPAPLSLVVHAWGQPEEDQWLEKTLIPDLERAGVLVELLRPSWPGRLAESLAEAQAVLLNGTPALAEGLPELSEQEFQLIREQIADRNQAVLGLRRGGRLEKLIPELPRSRMLDFRKGDKYFQRLFDLLVKIYRISPARVSDLKDLLVNDLSN